ncbi:hypothetical protein ACIBLA_31665 [Streptomyces sp. NPDC050433]
MYDVLGFEGATEPGDIRLAFDWSDYQERFSGTVVSPCAYDTG